MVKRNFRSLTSPRQAPFHRLNHTANPPTLILASFSRNPHVFVAISIFGSKSDGPRAKRGKTDR
jgi:hypothetical protein